MLIVEFWMRAYTFVYGCFWSVEYSLPFFSCVLRVAGGLIFLDMQADFISGMSCFVEMDIFDSPRQRKVGKSFSFLCTYDLDEEYGIYDCTWTFFPTSVF